MKACAYEERENKKRGGFPLCKRALAQRYSDVHQPETAYAASGCRVSPYVGLDIISPLQASLLGEMMSPPTHVSYYHIIPSMPPPWGIAGAGSLMLATQASVVRKVEATLVAFCRALLVTFVGSMMPTSTMFTYSSL